MISVSERETQQFHNAFSIIILLSVLVFSEPDMMAMGGGYGLEKEMNGLYSGTSDKSVIRLRKMFKGM